MRSLILCGLVVISPAAWAAGGEDTFVYTLTLFLHQALFVFWLGPDIGVYLWSTKLGNAETTPAQRLAAARVMPIIEVISKSCMSLMLTVGGILTQMKGVDHYWWQMPAIIILGPVWLTLTLLVFFRAGTAAGEQLARLDVLFRWLVVGSVCASVVFSMATGRLENVPWIAGKLLLFAAVVMFGLLMRSRLQPLSASMSELEQDGPSPALDARINATLGRARVFMFASWLGLLMAGALGTFQPGGAATPAELAAVTSMSR